MRQRCFTALFRTATTFGIATFFCGSCALIRRAALDAVGGIATGNRATAEDAHSTRCQQCKRCGYNTAYINIPQAAGLATESLAAIMSGSEIRWARGMIDSNSAHSTIRYLAVGLSSQPTRLCYFNAMVHFLYSVPRLVFLVAPLVYWLFDPRANHHSRLLGCDPQVYAFPHLILASLAPTNSRIQGRHRHSFWNEIYESVLAPYILWLPHCLP